MKIKNVARKLIVRGPSYILEVLLGDLHVLMTETIEKIEMRKLIEQMTYCLNR